LKRWQGKASEIKISVVIDLVKGEQAMKAVHAAFIG
jgi:aspartokinase